MQNQKKYQEFKDEEQYSRGIPVGQPLNYQLQPVQHNQAPYFQHGTNIQQPGNSPYQNQMYTKQNPVHMQQMNMIPQSLQSPMVLQGQNSKFYNQSINVRCQCCKQTVQTIVNNESGNTTYIWGALICCFVGQCCCLPFMFDDCLDKAHYCPNCGQTIIRKHAKCFDLIN